MYSRNRRHRSSPRSLHLSSDNINTTGKHVDTIPRDIYLDLVSSSRLLDERLRRRFSDRHKHGNGEDLPTSEESCNRDLGNGSRGDGEVERSSRNTNNVEPRRVDMDSYIPYGVRSRPPERGKWLAYAKNIKPRKQREGSNLSQSMENIDICTKYPRLQNSNFYQNLHKKYPQAFQRRLMSETKARRPRRLFNSGLPVEFHGDIYDSDDTRSVCSERPMSSLEHDLRGFLSYGDLQQDRDCRTSPTPSMMSDLTVKERLNATSDRLYHLLYNGLPQSHYRSSYDPGLTPRSEVTPRARMSRTSSVSSDMHGFDDLDNLSSPRHLDPYHRILDSNDLSQEEQIRSLQQQLEHKDRQLRTYRQKLNLETAGMHNTGSKHPENLESSYPRVISPDSPSDSAIDVESSSAQSVVSMDTRYHHNTDNSSTDVKYSNGSDKLHINGNLPNTGANYFANDLDSFTFTDVIQEVDEDDLTSDVNCTLSSNKGGIVSSNNVGNVSSNNDGNVSSNKDGTVSSNTCGTVSSNNDGMVSANKCGTVSSDKDSRLTPNKDNGESYSLAEEGEPNKELISSPPEVDVMMHEIVQQTMSKMPSSDLKVSDNDLQITAGNDLQISLGNDLKISPGNNILQSSFVNSSIESDLQIQAERHNSLNEEIDDSDPRLGIPEVKTDNENVIQERYYEKCKKIKYRTKRRCFTPREKPGSTCRNRTRSEDQVSVLCSPRFESNSLTSNDILQKSDVHRSNHSLNVVPERLDLRSRRLASESDITNVSLDNTGIFFSKSSNPGSIGSFQSDLSTNTLVASQQTLTEDDLTESYPKVTLHSHSPRKKIRFKNIFKFKKGHYNPSKVEANLPVDLEAMLKHSSVSDSPCNQEEHQNFYSVQYKKSKHHSHYAGEGESNVGESPQSDNRGNLTEEDLSDVREHLFDVNVHSHPVNDTNDYLNGQTVLGPPPSYSEHLEDSQRKTAYEVALVSLDQNGLDIDELIESDSDSVFSAKPVVIDSQQRKQSSGSEVQETDEEGTRKVGQMSIEEAEKRRSVSVDSEDEVFTQNVMTTAERTPVPNHVRLANLSLNMEKTESELVDKSDVNETVHSEEINNFAVDKARDMDEDSEGDTTEDSDNLDIEPIVIGEVDVVSPVNDDMDISQSKNKAAASTMQSNNTQETVHRIQGPEQGDQIPEPGISTENNGSEVHGIQGPEQGDQIPEPNINTENNGSEIHRIQGPEQGDQIPEPGISTENNRSEIHRIQGPEQGDQIPEPGISTENNRSEIHRIQGPEQGDQGLVPDITRDSNDHAPVEGPYATVTVHRDTSVSSETQINSDSNIYSEVELTDKTQDSDSNKTKGDNLRKHFSFVTASSNMDDSITVLDQSAPPIPKRAYQREESNLVRSKELSVSKQSLTDKVRSSARSKFKAIRKAVSLDKGLNKAGTDNSDDITKDKNKEKKKSGFKMPKIKNPLHFGKKKSKPPMAPVSNVGKERYIHSQHPCAFVLNWYVCCK
ncbi:uncharacterized protein LOC132557528 [Ylistrum balloti]|uniref:uncharacterized protein LOC132557528 n=1 Tax=Ylistrum balloti TaxID=509963 RepID=UPI002905A697|nr:uncharacterized protein LOC132557528 [Ylistrum balloti]